MAVYPLQSSNVFSYTFAGHGNTHTHYLVAGNNNPVLNIGGQSWTIECWLKPTGIYSNYNSIFSKRRGTGATKGTDVSYQGALDASTGFVLYYDGAGGGASYSTTRLTSNAWSHVAWVFNQGANVRIFVNGVNVATNSAVTSVANIDSQFFIGLNPGQNSQYFGDISNLRIVLGQALYSGESFNVSTYPMQLPNNSIGPHVGTGNVAASLTGNVVLLTCNDQIIKTNGNARINGVSTNSGISINGDVYPHLIDTNELQHYSFVNFNPTSTANSAQTSGSFMLTTDSANLNIPSGDFTIECWAYTTTPAVSGLGGGDIIQRGGAVNIAWPSWAITAVQGNVYFSGSNTNARMDIGGDGSNGVGGNVHRGYIGTWTPNTWNHIAIVRTGTTYNGYLNGVLGYTETTANTPYNATGRGIVIMGGFENASNVWTAGGVSYKALNGYITDARIVKRALYTTNFTPPRTPLQLLPNTAFLLKSSGSLPIDATGNVTISSNGTGILYFTTVNPYTSNATINANSTTQIVRMNSLGRRQERIYDKLDIAEYTMIGFVYHASGRRQGRIYDKLDIAEYSFSGPMLNTIGLRQGKINDKLDIAEYISSVPLYSTTGGRQQRIYSKLDTSRYAYIPSGTGGGGGTANIEYEFWS